MKTAVLLALVTVVVAHPLVSRPRELVAPRSIFAIEPRAAFTLSNGQDAQKLNAKFATLTADAACTDGDQACVNGDFAQCTGGKFQTTPCAGGTVCAALPLVNKAGTSISCDTSADAEARIAATGATGGLTGDGSGGAAGNSAATPAADTSSCATGASSSAVDTGSSATDTSSSATDTSSSATDTSSATDASAGQAAADTTGSNIGASDFQLSNGQEAQKLNAQFATLTATSSCTDGENACIDGGFAQCTGGQFTVNQCSGGTSCFALPLVNKAGTSITCDTEADALARIQATGATGGVTG